MLMGFKGHLIGFLNGLYWALSSFKRDFLHLTRLCASSWLADRIQLLKDLLLQAHILEDGLHHQVAVSQL